MKYLIAIIGLILLGLVVFSMMPYYILKVIAGIIAIIVIGEIVAMAMGMGND